MQQPRVERQLLVRLFFLKVRRPRRSTLCPYTTLFRSAERSSLSRVAALHDPGAVGLQRHGRAPARDPHRVPLEGRDRKSTRLNSSHANISYAVFCLTKKVPDVSYLDALIRLFSYTCRI